MLAVLMISENEYTLMCPTEKCNNSAVCSWVSAEGEGGPCFGTTVCKERHKPGQVWTRVWL